MNTAKVGHNRHPPGSRSSFDQRLPSHTPGQRLIPAELRRNRATYHPSPSRSAKAETVASGLGADAPVTLTLPRRRHRTHRRVSMCLIKISRMKVEVIIHLGHRCHLLVSVSHTLLRRSRSLIVVASRSSTGHVTRPAGLLDLARAYGTFTPQEILATVPDRLDATTQTSRATAKSGDQAMRDLINPDAPDRCQASKHAAASSSSSKGPLNRRRQTPLPKPSLTGHLTSAGAISDDGFEAKALALVNAKH